MNSIVLLRRNAKSMLMKFVDDRSTLHWFIATFCTRLTPSDIDTFSEDFVQRNQAKNLTLAQIAQADHWGMHKDLLDNAHKLASYKSSRIFCNYFQQSVSRTDDGELTVLGVVTQAEDIVNKFRNECMPQLFSSARSLTLEAVGPLLGGITHNILLFCIYVGMIILTILQPCFSKKSLKFSKLLKCVCPRKCSLCYNHLQSNMNCCDLPNMLLCP